MHVYLRTLQELPKDSQLHTRSCIASMAQAELVKCLPGASACFMADLPCRWCLRSLASGPSWRCQLSR